MPFYGGCQGYLDFFYSEIRQKFHDVQLLPCGLRLAACLFFVKKSHWANTDVYYEY